MAIIRVREAVALERLAGKMAYILEQVLRLRDKKCNGEYTSGFEDAVSELQNVSEHEDVQRAYDLFKRMSNTFIDMPELRAKEEE